MRVLNKAINMLPHYEQDEVVTLMILPGDVNADIYSAKNKVDKLFQKHVI